MRSLFALTLGTSMLAACHVAPPAEAASRCELRAIVQFKASVDNPTDANFLGKLGKETGAQIAYDHALGGKAHLLRLSSTSDATACDRALQLLQTHSAVAYAQADARKHN